MSDIDNTPNTADTVNTTVTNDEPVIEVSHLSVTYRSARRTVTAVDDVTFTVRRGETVGIVGESGSGKSTLVDTFLGILPDNADVTGTFSLFGEDYTHAGEQEWRRVRGRVLGFVPQDPRTNLDPTMTVGKQTEQIVRLRHPKQSRDEASKRVVELFTEVGIDRPGLRYRQYPHELSGGLQQRVLIAQALASEPEVIVADEPTSALDVTVQKRILDVLESLVRKRGITLVMITHDLAVASDRTQRLLVIHNGRLVEHGGTRQVLDHPHEAYTRHLIACAPAFQVNDNVQDGEQGEGAQGIEADAVPDDDIAVNWNDVSKVYHERGGRGAAFNALNHVSLTARTGRTLAIVGESGSGKSTLLRLALALSAPTSGTVLVDGRNIHELHGRALRAERRNFQLVQQNPFDSLDPNYTVRKVIDEPLRAFGYGNRRRRNQRIAELLDRVSLPARLLDAKGSELSGGQCQRVAIARALAISPKILFLDEPVSALDVSVQSQILDLLKELQESLGVTYVFVSHDLAVVAGLADDIAVLEHGNIVEHGNVDDVFGHPHDAYTKKLLDAIPGR
ncbi:dipeptide ABC transporter ATP-binding protein [Bifidobacterium catulorum]|uniref:ABC transporter ATP-binding protein n=1 Tax=Bifidobacterium catulorum TaxID=1630173 RepID=A0A2U2MQL5_9BIFI|nr:ABC transporter ATP-binding protein [Bifidobacterium catulorum]PWG59148.1 ABC transporter ATP-binding protein [Bifidobacterium catulorum]